MRIGAIAFAAAAGMLVSCHRDVTVLGPDAQKPQLYVLEFVNNNTPPVLVEALAFGATRWLLDAHLGPVDLGRGTDPRVFEDRSGNGPNGSTSRDSTSASGRMADVRVFEERNAAGVVLATVRDSIVVDVQRHGDTLFVRRESINPALNGVDTALFYGPIIVMKVRQWTSDPAARRINGLMTYNITQ